MRPTPLSVPTQKVSSRPAIARAFGDEFAVGLLVGLGLLEGGDLGLGEDQAAPQAIFACSALSRRFMVCRSWRSQTERTPKGEIDIPCLANSFDTRVWS